MVRRSVAPALTMSSTALESVRQLAAQELVRN
jgi:hypothetical protein